MFALLFRRSRLARDLAVIDRKVADHLGAVDRSLARWSTAINRPNIGTDMLLDERLYYRPPDVMVSAGEWGLAA